MLESLERAQSIVREALVEFGDSICVLTSFQREGIVIVDLALRWNAACRVVTIDTGRLPATTLAMVDRIEKHFGITVERLTPEPAEVEAMVGGHGIDLFRESVPKRMLCCEVRKVRPLRQLESTARAVFVGLRRDQSESRADIPVVERQKTLVRVSPLADWSAGDVLEYTRKYELPEHPLYAAGYSTIGCDPCTRAVAVGEPERSGRWWWENEADKECGLHFAADGRVIRTVDVLVEDLLVQVAAK